MVLIWEPETGLVTACTSRHEIAVHVADYTDKGPLAAFVCVRQASQSNLKSLKLAYEYFITTGTY